MTSPVEERISWLTGEPVRGPALPLGPVAMATLDIGILMAIADGELTESERQRLAENVVQLAAGALDRLRARAGVDRCVELFEEGAHEDTLDSAVAQLPDDSSRARAFRFAVAVAFADGRLDRAEARLIERLASALGLSPATASTLIDDVRAALRR